MPVPQPVSIQVIREARLRARDSGTKVVAELETLLACPRAEFLERLGATFRYPVVGMEVLRSHTPATDLIPFTECLRRECVAVRDVSGRALVVFSDPFDELLPVWLEQQLQPALPLQLAHPADLSAFLARCEETFRAMDALRIEPSEKPVAQSGEVLSLKAISGDASAVVRLVNSTIYDALKAGASDIHVESDANGMQVKYRIDGVLVSIASVPGVEQAEQVISRIKVLAELDIAERRIPQDGRFKVMIEGREIDLRVSIIPSVFGEDAVLRILDRRALSREAQTLRLETLGFDAHSMQRIRQLAREPYGMLLVTGPTGSGKTTTLYAALTEINTGQDKIITIEDPVEYQVPGVLQIPVNEKKGLTFARGLRSILRHDPDKIMVGEIRDPETAQIAVQSALTGHLVFTTIHANNVFDVLGRIMHMNIDAYSFASALNGIVAQRLVRLNCPQCVQDDKPSAELLQRSGLTLEHSAGFRFSRGAGCSACRGSGYRGRKAIAEILLMNDEIRRLIVNRALAGELRVAAQDQGIRYLREQALTLVRQGESTLEEINRVTFVG
jgi:general secretion pathway protein E